MKFYYSPGACSFSPHVVLQELGLAYTPIRVELATGEIEGGGHIRDIHSKSYVPLLVLDDGTLLSEGPVILQYLADLVPDSGLLPRTWLERYRVLEWVNYIAMEIHKNFGGLLDGRTLEPERARAMKHLLRRYEIIEAALASHPFLAGETFTLADAYLFTATSWTRLAKVDISAFSALRTYMRTMAKRPSVIATYKAEGLLL